MVTTETAEEEEPSPLDQLPEGTDRVVLLYKTLQVRVTDAKLDAWREDNDVSDDVRYVRFEAGDELPLEVAGATCPGVQDRYAAFDADGERLDTASRPENRNFETGIRFPGQ